MSKDSATLSHVIPSAAPTPEELAEWHALPRDEQARRLGAALEAGFNAPAVPDDIDAIIAEAKAELLASGNG